MPAVLAGAVAALLGGALIGVAVSNDPETAVGSSSPSSAATASVAVSDTPSQSGQQTPASSPTPPVAAVIPNLGIAEVVTDSANLRAAAAEDAETLYTLRQGERLFIVGEPADAGELRWYRVALVDGPVGECANSCEVIGFVATPTTEADSWIREATVECPPSPMTAEQINALRPLEALHCYGRDEIVITGTIDLPLEGATTPLEYSPAWLADVEAVVPLFRGTWVAFRPHPDAGLEPPERGDVVRATGHFEDPAAVDCRAEPDPDSFGGEVPPEFVPTSRAWMVLTCRARFAWTEYEVTGFEDLGP